MKLFLFLFFEVIRLPQIFFFFNKPFNILELTQRGGHWDKKKPQRHLRGLDVLSDMAL